MSERYQLNVQSEIGRLRRVMLHRPQDELDNVAPSIMHDLLFDDVPDKLGAGREYDVYEQILREAGVDILYVEDLLAEALADPQRQQSFADRFLAISGITEPARRDALLSRYLSLGSVQKMISALIRGLRKEELTERESQLFRDFRGSDYPLVLDPLSNLYFTRDPFIVLGNSVSTSRMYYRSRWRESFIGQTIFTQHPAFAGKITIHSYEGSEQCIEGGDILILSPQIVAIGQSERTMVKSIEHLAESLFQNGGMPQLEHVLAFQIPARRAFMHLDTVFTMLDRDCFVVHRQIEDTLRVVDMTWQQGKLLRQTAAGTLEDILKNYLGLSSLRLISCGGGSAIDGEREQWNDGSNTLAIAPGEIIVYERNYVTNALFREAGLHLHYIPASELAKGRGGPHCMSMPFYRESLSAGRPAEH